ncbi:MAG: XkdX family protein [Lachnospiraceae bacterium]|nr:XkdX family protein [Lachnospiraceae bacterium]
MYERLKRLYSEGVLSIQGLRNAVEKKLITEEQFTEITGQPFKE